MKTIFALIAFLFSVSSFASFDRLPIKNWDPELTTTPQKILDTLRIESRYFAFDEEEGTCGGQIISPAITRMQKYQSEDGEILFYFIVHFEVNEALDNCEDTIHTKCTTSFSVLPGEVVSMGQWLCEND
ncbi:MAG: hypothetical protein A2Z20_12870 [Bdellovibrionales bacterium RBG_16_40_8]|nr:MAG: hypothetical protein A2Z20_12870 [Bdellovibrionales bacterium RBG_16_40_8]